MSQCALKICTEKYPDLISVFQNLESLRLIIDFVFKVHRSLLSYSHNQVVNFNIKYFQTGADVGTH